MLITAKLAVGAAFVALVGVPIDKSTVSTPPEPLLAASPVSYIVVVKTGIDPMPVADELSQHLDVKILRRYHAALNGFAISLPTPLVPALRADPRVSYIEADSKMTGTGQTLPFGVNRIDADLSRTLAGNGSGAIVGVNGYVIDTGISTHTDLNVVGHQNWTGDGKNYDCNGHGTHVAGTIGARDNAAYVVGVAPGVPLTDLKVLGCNESGLTSNVIAAVDWVATNAKKPAVVNMSLSGPPSAALDSAVLAAAGKGVLIVVAAGNNGADACNYSPARAGAGTDNGVITVGATDSANAAASFSNYGSCVDIWAPGVAIVSTSFTGSTTTMSGTSMAAPHVSGAGLLYEAVYKTTYMPSSERILKSRILATGKTSKDGRAINIVDTRTY